MQVTEYRADGDAAVKARIRAYKRRLDEEAKEQLTVQTREQKVKEEDQRTMSRKLSTAEQELVERKRLLEQMKAQQAKGIFQQRNDHKSGLPQCSKCARPA